MDKKLRPLEIIAKSEIFFAFANHPNVLLVSKLKKPKKQYGVHYVIGPGDDKELVCQFSRDNNVKYLVKNLGPSIKNGEGITEVVISNYAISMSNYAIFEIHKKKATLPSNISYDSIPFDEYQKFRSLKTL